MTSLPGWFNQQFFKDNGDPAANWRVYTYATGTTTHKDAYTDASGATPQTYTSDGLGGQYIALNARGELASPLFLGTGGYDIVLKDDTGATEWTRYAIGTDEDATALDTAIRADLAGTAAGDGADLIGFRPTMTAADSTLAGALMDGAVNLEWWSHLVTGNDYTTALAAAVATGKNVYVPYRLATRTVSTGVSFANNNQTVFGDNPDSARIQFTGSTGVTFNADGKTGCRVVGLWLEGPGVASSISSTYTQCGFRAITATRCDAIGCVFSGWAGGGVFIQDATDCRVLNNSFTDAKTMPLVTDAFGTADITLWGSCVDCMVDGNRSNSGAAYGVVLQTINSTTQTARRNSITRNVISGAKNYGILVYNYSSGTPPVVNNIYDTLIQGNTVETVYGYYNNPATGNKDYGAGIYVLSSEGTRVIGNTVKDVCKDTNGSALTPAGIAINATSKAVVSANYIDTSAWYGVFVVDSLQLGSGANQASSAYIPDGFVIVEGNTIKATTRHGVYVQNKHKVRVSGNTIDTVSGASQSGIVAESTLTGTTYPTLKWLAISDNTVYNVTSSCIQASTSTAPSITGNTLEIGTTGIFAETIDAVISSNIIRNITTGSGRGIDLRTTSSSAGSTITGNSITGCTVGILASHTVTWGENRITGNVTNYSGVYASWISGTYNPPSIASGGTTTTTLTVTGAAVGDFVDASFSLDLSGLQLSAYVSAADTVTFVFQNPTGGAIDLASGTIRAKLRKV
jgi:Right handed beta helix region